MPPATLTRKSANDHAGEKEGDLLWHALASRHGERHPDGMVLNYAGFLVMKWAFPEDAGSPSHMLNDRACSLGCSWMW